MEIHLNNDPGNSSASAKLSHLPSAKSKLLQLEDIDSIDSEPDRNIPIKARIVRLSNGDLKIQCLECLKTPLRYLTHFETSKCKNAFPPEDKIILNELIQEFKNLKNRIKFKKFKTKNSEKIKSKDRARKNKDNLGQV